MYISVIIYNINLLFKLISLFKIFFYKRLDEWSPLVLETALLSGFSPTIVSFSLLDNQISTSAQTFVFTLVYVSGLLQLIPPDISVVVTIPENNQPTNLLLTCNSNCTSVNVGTSVDFLINGFVVYDSVVNISIVTVNGAPAVAQWNPMYQLVFLLAETNVTHVSFFPVDTGIPTLSTNFLFLLIPISGNILSPVYPTVVTITANNDPYGIFTIDNVLTPMSAPYNATTYNVFLTRARGSFTFVSVNWVITELSDLSRPVSLDFLSPSGTISFADGQATAVVNLYLISDNVPTLARLFNFSLVNISAGALGAINTLAISKDASYNAHGTFQMAITAIFINNSIGVLSLQVKRLPGLFGAVAVGWYTSDGPRNASGAVTGVDYSSVSGVAVFQENQIVAVINISIVQSYVPSIVRLFSVSLNGSFIVGAAHISTENTTTTVYISPHDFADGTFSLGPGPAPISKPQFGVNMANFQVHFFLNVALFFIFMSSRFPFFIFYISFHLFFV